MTDLPTQNPGPPYDVVVVGAGAAGLLAAARAATRGKRTLLLEKNPRPGVKILISGGTRCNLTHATDARGIVKAYGPPGKFLHSALAALGPRELVALFEAEGVPTKVEETGKVFPQSNQARDVLTALLRMLARSGAELALAEPVIGIRRVERGEAPPHGNAGLLANASDLPASFVLATPRREIGARNVVLTVGGKSYPGCGTTGDGYAWLAALGHTLVPPRPALVPITSDAAWVAALKGVTVPDVHVRVTPRGSGPRGALAERRASFLFTHFGLSGPAALDVSRAVTAATNPRELELLCDFLPAVSAEALEARLKAECLAAGKKHLANILPPEIPRRLGESLLAQLELGPEKKGAELAKQDRQRLVTAIKGTRIPIAGTRGFAKAEVTAGGASLAEVDSRTMQSKLVPGLYLAGEILDLDGPIGGFNFQAAFSTGYLAGESVA